MEFWGLCPECDRWFYCEQWSDPSSASPICPVCRTPAAVIEERNASGAQRLTDWVERLELPGFDEARQRHRDAAESTPA